MRSIVKGAILAAASAAMISALTVPASADPSQAVAASDITVVGSDTIEFLGNDQATAYNGQTPAPANLMDSWNATNPTTGAVHDTITIKPGITITRPNGSSEGISALQSNTNIDAARSSRAPRAGDTGLLFLPVAEDTVRYALSGTTPSNGIDGITNAQLASIYQCTATTWTAVGGTSTATIQPLLPQTGSGTRAFFLGQIGLTDAQVGACVTTVQEHDPAPIANNANAIAPFSVARYNTKVTLGSIKLNTTGFVGYRPVYYVVRDAGGFTVPAALRPLFGDGSGTNGWICSAAGQAVVTQDGFTALPDHTSSFCGVAEHL